MHDTHWTYRGAMAAFNAIVEADGHPDWRLDPESALGRRSQRRRRPRPHARHSDGATESVHELRLPGKARPEFLSEGVTPDLVLASGDAGADGPDPRRLVHPVLVPADAVPTRRTRRLAALSVLRVRLAADRTVSPRRSLVDADRTRALLRARRKAAEFLRTECRAYDSMNVHPTSPAVDDRLVVAAQPAPKPVRAGMLPRFRRWFAGLILLLLATPLVWGMVRPDSPDFILKEGRRAAGAPRAPASPKEWLALPAGIDAYLKDHFGLRYAMIRLHKDLTRPVFQKVNPYILVGRDGRMFYLGNEMVRQSAGLVLRDQKVAEVAQLVASMRDALAKRGRRLSGDVPPNSSTIYQDDLPGLGAEQGKENGIRSLFRRFGRARRQDSRFAAGPGRRPQDRRGLSAL